MMRRCLVLLLGMVFGFAQATDIGLSPPRLELTGRAGETITETVTVLTDENEQQQIQVGISDWTLDPEGNLSVLPPSSLSISAAAWLEPEASEFVLEANQTRDFRVSVTIPEDAELNGTYHAMVFFTVVPDALDSAGVAVVTTTRIGLTIYVTVAETEESGAELVDFYQADEANVNFAVVNEGNTVMRLGGMIELRDELGEMVTRLEVPDVPLLRESEREVALPLPEDIDPGFYIALAFIEDSRGGLLIGELPIEVP